MDTDRLVLSEGVRSVPIVHCHIPRTGGISIDYFFREIFGDDRCIRLGSRQDFDRLADPEAPFHRFHWSYLSAHLPVRSLMDIVGGRSVFLFTVVRDPVQREISAFKYIAERGGAYEPLEVRTFDDYLSLKERLQERNLQCSHIQMGAEPATSVSVELLRYLAAGHSILTLGKVFILQEYMRAAIGCRYIIESQNAGTTRLELTDLQRRRLQPYIERDLELFDLVSAAEQSGNLIKDWRARWESSSSPPASAADQPRGRAEQRRKS